MDGNIYFYDRLKWEETLLLKKFQQIIDLWIFSINNQNIRILSF